MERKLKMKKKILSTIYDYAPDHKVQKKIIIINYDLGMKINYKTFFPL